MHLDWVNFGEGLRNSEFILDRVLLKGEGNSLIGYPNKSSLWGQLIRVKIKLYLVGEWEYLVLQGLRNDLVFISLCCCLG